MLLVCDARAAREVWCMVDSDSNGAKRAPKRGHAKLASERRVLPICMRRGHWPWTVLVCGVAAGVGVTAMLAALVVDASRLDWLRDDGLAIVLGSLVASVILTIRKMRREYAGIERAGFMRCPGCLAEIPAPTVTGDDEIACPGCAQRYGTDELRQTWRRVYGKTAQWGVWKFDRAARRRIGRRRVFLCGAGFVMAATIITLGTIHHAMSMSNHRATLPTPIAGLFFVCALGIPLVFLVEAGASLMLDSGRAARVRGPLRETRGRLCPACLHDLRGIGDAGQCPECGEAFTRDSLADWWGSVE